MEPKERLKTAAIAMGSDLKKQTITEPGEKATETVASMDMVQTITKDWPAMSKQAVRLTIDQYGPPNEAIPSRLIWYNNGPWKRTIIYRDEIPHDFPEPHSDVIEQFIDYRVPPEMFSELAKFDGSIIAERTKGEVSSRCDMEAANILALNLMNDIVTGKLTAKKAREVSAEVMSAYMLNRSAPYAEKFQFEVLQEDTIDTDEAVILESMIHQAGEKIEDVLRGQER